MRVNHLSHFIRKCLLMSVTYGYSHVKWFPSIWKEFLDILVLNMYSFESNGETY